MCEGCDHQARLGVALQELGKRAATQQNVRQCNVRRLKQKSRDDLGDDLVLATVQPEDFGVT